MISKEPSLLSALLSKAVDGDSDFYRVGHFNSTEHSFSIAFLRSPPSSLQNLAEQQVDWSTTDKLEIQCSHLGVSLLSAPLPSAVPASISLFLTTILDNILKKPSTEGMLSVYDVLNGLGPTGLSCVSADVSFRLQDQLIKLLKATEIENNSAHLACLAILAKLASAECRDVIEGSLDQAGAPGNTTSEGPTHAVRYAAARQFIAKRATKILDLVVLKVMWSCSRSSKLSTFQALQNLDLAREIKNAIQEEEVKIWQTKNVVKIKKLGEKILAMEHWEIQFAVFVSLTQGLQQSNVELLGS